MVFTRQYLVFSRGENRIIAFFNSYEDAKEYLERITKYPNYLHFGSCSIYEKVNDEIT